RLLPRSILTVTTTLMHSTYPYTTLFRSIFHLKNPIESEVNELYLAYRRTSEKYEGRAGAALSVRRESEPSNYCGPSRRSTGLLRSEEHTSELQSRENLVCRLLLEKKNVL